MRKGRDSGCGLGSPVDLEVNRRGAMFVLVTGSPGRMVRLRFNG